MHLQTHQSFFESGAGEGRWSGQELVDLHFALRSFPSPLTPNFLCGLQLRSWPGITGFLYIHADILKELITVGGQLLEYLDIELLLTHDNIATLATGDFTGGERKHVD